MAILEPLLWTRTACECGEGCWQKLLSRSPKDRAAHESPLVARLLNVGTLRRLIGRESVRFRYRSQIKWVWSPPPLSSFHRRSPHRHLLTTVVSRYYDILGQRQQDRRIRFFYLTNSITGNTSVGLKSTKPIFGVCNARRRARAYCGSERADTFLKRPFTINVHARWVLLRHL